MTINRRQAREMVARGVGAWERDEFEAALQTFLEVLADHPDFADVHNKAGLCAAMLGRLDTALEHFDAALKRNDAHAEAHLNRAIVLSELGADQAARDGFARVGELDSVDDHGFPSELGHRIAISHGRLAELYQAAGSLEEARDHFELALGIRPNFMDIRDKFAESLIQAGALEQARSELLRVLESRPGFVDARIRLGSVLQRLGDVDGAVEQWRKASGYAPADRRPVAYLASVGVVDVPEEE